MIFGFVEMPHACSRVRLAAEVRLIQGPIKLSARRAPRVQFLPALELCSAPALVKRSRQTLVHCTASYGRPKTVGLVF